MPASSLPADPILAVREWVVKAEHDLSSASKLTRCPGATNLSDVIAYHAQQCAEKYIKAVLTLHGISFPKSHDLDFLSDLLPAQFRPSADLTDLDVLSMLEVRARYPGYSEVTKEQARWSVRLCRAVRRDMRRHLPRAVRGRVG
jgi:HEPN domain-containing protein